MTTTTAAAVVTTVTTTVTNAINDIAIAEPQMMQTAMPTTTGELDDADAITNNEEEQAMTTTTMTATTLDEDAAAWSRTRFARKEHMERTYSSMTRTAGILRAQMAGDNTNNNKDNSLALSKVVAAYPNVSLLDVEKIMLPVARCLMGGLGIWKDDLASVLQLYLTLLGKTIEDLERVIAYVLSLGIEEDDLTQIFRAFPVLFTLRLQEDIEPVVEYLRSIVVKDVGAFITTLPPVLEYSVNDELKQNGNSSRQSASNPSLN